MAVLGADGLYEAEQVAMQTYTGGCLRSEIGMLTGPVGSCGVCCRDPGASGLPLSRSGGPRTKTTAEMMEGGRDAWRRVGFGLYGLVEVHRS